MSFERVHKELTNMSIPYHGQIHNITKGVDLIDAIYHHTNTNSLSDDDDGILNKEQELIEELNIGKVTKRTPVAF